MKPVGPDDQYAVLHELQKAGLSMNEYSVCSGTLRGQRGVLVFIGINDEDWRASGRANALIAITQSLQKPSLDDFLAMCLAAPDIEVHQAHPESRKSPKQTDDDSDAHRV